MSGAYDDCGSDAYDDGQPRTLDLLSADYGDASQLTWYVGDDGLVHACAHNLLRSSANFEDGIWGGTGTVAGPQLLSLTAGQTGGYQAFNGTSNRYQSINGETYTLTSTVEVTAVTTPGEVNGRLLSNTGVNSISATLTNIGDTATLSVTHIAGSTNMQVFVCNSTTFEGTVKITNLCASVGSETFPYIKTDETGARYMYRLPENLRRWSGTAYTTSKIVELNTGVTVNALVEGVGVTNLVDYHNGDTTGAWTATRSVWSQSSDTDPAGALGAGTITDDSTLASTHLIQHNITVADTVEIRVQGMFKANGRTEVLLRFVDKAGTTHWVGMDLTDGSQVTSLGSPANIVMKSMAGGWYFMSFTVGSATGATSPYIAIYPLVSGSVTYDGDGTSGIHMWGVSFSQTSFVPQPILTYGSSVTRAAETPTTSDFAGASTNQNWSAEFLAVSLVSGTALMTFSEFKNFGTELAGFIMSNSSGSMYVTSVVFDGSPVYADLIRRLVTDTRFSLVVSRDADADVITSANSDGTSSGVGSASTAAQTVGDDLDYTFYLGNGTFGSDAPVSGFQIARYLPNALISEAACLKRAQDLMS